MGLMINEGKVFTNKEYREHFGVSNWTCVGDMKLLEKHGFVIVEGKGKSTVYSIEHQKPLTKVKKTSRKTHDGRKKVGKARFKMNFLMQKGLINRNDQDGLFLWRLACVRIDWW